MSYSKREYTIDETVISDPTEKKDIVIVDNRDSDILLDDSEDWNIIEVKKDDVDTTKHRAASYAAIKINMALQDFCRANGLPLLENSNSGKIDSFIKRYCIVRNNN